MSATPSVKLQEIMASSRGSVDPAKFSNEVFDLYSIPAFDSGEPEVLAGSEIGSTKQVVCPGDVLLSRIVPHIRRAWVVGEARGRRTIASGEWIVFRSNRFHPSYLRHLLVSDRFHSEFMRTVSGVGGSLLRARPINVARIEIPLPPQSEQKRIAAILDQADAIRRKRHRAIQNVTDIAPAVFHQMFPDQDADSTATLNQLGVEFRYGTSNKSQPTGFPTLRIPNVLAAALDLTDLKTVPVESNEFDRLKLHDGDLLFVRTNGNPAYVGRCAVFNSRLIAAAGYDPEEFIYASYLIRGRADSRVVNPRYLRAFLDTPRGRRMVREQCRTSAGQYNINTHGLGSLEVPVPPIQRQEQFAQQLEEITSLEAKTVSAFAESERLFDSLAQRAFRGGL
jgi:type I restriction enzyme S subunit